MNLAPLNKAFDQRGSDRPARRAALDALIASGFPTRRDEQWKYTRSESLADFALRNLGSEPAPASRAEGLHDEIIAAADAFGDVGLIAFIDGQLAPSLTRLPDGVTLTDNDGDDQTIQPGAANALGLLNRALPSADLVLTVADGNDTPQPLHVMHRVSGADALSQVRLTLRVGAGAQLTLVEHFDDAADCAQMHNTVLNASVASGAGLRLRRLQSLSEQALQVTRIEADLAAGASLDTLTLDIGGKLTRNDLNVRLNGEDARVTMRGIYLGSGSQHIDNHTRVDHVAKHTTSVEDYRGILRDRCRCVFNGKVMVHDGADGTDAAQSNPNLLMSDDAEIDTKPELEIYADDVKCSHGATVGQIDNTSLFYLRSRGIDEATAVQLLTYAFCREALVAVDNDALRMQMERMVAEQIPDFSALELIT